MAGRKIGEIYGEIKIKNQQFNTGLTQSQSKLKAFKQSATIAFKALAVGATAAALAMGKAIKDTMRYALEVDKASKATGVAVEQFQELSYAAKQEHADMEALQKGLGNLTIRLGYAGDGLETYLRYFRALGLEYQNQDGSLRKTEDVFMDIADKAHKGALSTEELAAITQLFGARAGRVLIPMLRKGSEWFKEMADEARNLGIILDEELVVKMKAFDDNMTKMKSGIQGAKIAFTEGLFPALENIADIMATDIERTGDMRDMLKSFGEWIGMMSARIMDFVNNARVAISEMGAFLTNNIIKIVEDFEKLPWIGEKATEWKASLEALNTGFREQSIALQDLSGYTERYMEGLDKIKEKTEDVKEETEEAIEKAFVFSDVSLGPYLYEMDEAYKKMINIKNAAGKVEDGIYNITSAANIMGDVMTDVFRIMGEEYEDAADQMDDMVGAWKDLVTGIISTVGGPVGVIAGAVAGFLGFQKGGFVPGQLIPQVSSGYVQKPSVLVGEGKGGELVIPEDKLKGMVQVSVHNANPHTYVETLINLPQSEKQRLYRRVTKEASDREGRR